MSEAIELRGLSKSFGPTLAVDDVSLQVRPGELLTLLGPSGCGKTTLLRMLSGFEQPTRGSIHIGGRDITPLPPHRRDINQVFQSYALFPHLTVRDNIAFGLKMQGLESAVIAERIARVIELVALQGLESRLPNELSGGQRQRVALARAVVPEPRVLLLDEPLSALDAKLRRGMQIELKRLQRQLGLTTILVTHDQEEALALSDRIAVMRAGRIEQLGSCEEVYYRPRTTFVAEFLGEANILDATIESLSPLSVRVAEGPIWRATPGHESAAAASTDNGLVTPVKLGDVRKFALRPERIRIEDANTPREPGSNCFEAQVIERVFLGSSLRLLVRPDFGATLSVIVTENSPLSTHVGQNLRCHFAAEDLFLLVR